MSFAKEQKEDILSVVEKNVCCRRALLLGVMFAKANIVEDELKLTLEGNSTVLYASTLIQEFYSKSPDILKNTSGGRGKTISFNSKSAIKYIRNLKEKTICEPKCSACSSAFLRGVFLACGRVSEPSKQHNLELALLPERVPMGIAYLATLGL